MIPWWTVPVAVAMFAIVVWVVGRERRLYRAANPRRGDLLAFDTPAARRALADAAVVLPLPEPRLALQTPGHGDDDWFGGDAA